MEYIIKRYDYDRDPHYLRGSRWTRNVGEAAGYANASEASKASARYVEEFEPATYNVEILARRPEPVMVEVRASDLAEVLGVAGVTTGDDGYPEYSRLSKVLRDNDIDRPRYRLEGTDAVRVEGTKA